MARGRRPDDKEKAQLDKLARPRDDAVTLAVQLRASTIC